MKTLTITILLVLVAAMAPASLSTPTDEAVAMVYAQTGYKLPVVIGQTQLWFRFEADRTEFMDKLYAKPELFELFKARTWKERVVLSDSIVPTQAEWEAKQKEKP